MWKVEEQFPPVVAMRIKSANTCKVLSTVYNTRVSAWHFKFLVAESSSSRDIHPEYTYCQLDGLAITQTTRSGIRLVKVTIYEGPFSRKPWVTYITAWVTCFSLPAPQFLVVCFKLVNKEWICETLDTQPSMLMKARSPGLLYLSLSPCNLAKWPLRCAVYTPGLGVITLIPQSSLLGFPGGSLVKNPPTNAGDMGLIPGPGRSHMPQSN